MIKSNDTDRRRLVLEGNLLKAILTLAIPVMINSLIQSMYNLTDTYWLGQIGTDYQAAITLVSPIQNILITFGSGITTAGSVLISQYLGAKQDKQANIMANHICVCSLIFSLICATLCWLFAPAIVGAMGAEGNLYTYGISYIRIVVLDLPFLFMINMYTAVKQSQGDTIKPMLLNLLGVTINLILDPIFLVVFDMKIEGAALATLLAKIPSALIGLWAITRGNQLIKVSFKKFRFERSKIISIIRIGLPAAVGGSAMQFGYLLMSSSVNTYGATALSAYGIGNKIGSIITMPIEGFGSAIAIIVGQNFGAGNINRSNKAFHLALRVGVIFLLVCGITVSRPFIAEKLVRIFTVDDNVVPLAVSYLSVMMFWCWTNTFHDVVVGLFQGAGHTAAPVVVDAARLWIFRFGTLWVCSNLLGMGVESVWYAVVVSNAAASLILYILYWTGMWKKATIKIEKES
ncbi:MAG: MATE family efflux transporter [Lachnospira sp.]|nr:MATE family efflux transporter [Lachnospira sp.]